MEDVTSQIVQKHSEEQRTEDTQESKMEVIDFNVADLVEVDHEKKDIIDFDKYRLQENEIESVEIVRIKSKYSRSEDGKVHRMKIIGSLVEKVEHGGSMIEIRPTELINLEENEKGELKGLPNGEKSEWMRLKKTLNVNGPKDLIGKKLPIRINESKTGVKFLGYMY